jgi:tetratricopeptide (TPR) repeat protein
MEARIHSVLGRYDLASTSLKRGFEIQPMPEMAYNLGNSLINEGKAGESVQYLAYFLQYYPDRKDVAEKLETVRILERLESQIHSYPDSTELYVYAAYQYLRLGQHPVSDSLVRVAYRLDPGNDLLKKVLGNTVD